MQEYRVLRPVAKTHASCEDLPRPLKRLLHKAGMNHRSLYMRGTGPVGGAVLRVRCGSQISTNQFPNESLDHCRGSSFILRPEGPRQQSPGSGRVLLKGGSHARSPGLPSASMQRPVRSRENRHGRLNASRGLSARRSLLPTTTQASDLGFAVSALQAGLKCCSTTSTSPLSEWHSPPLEALKTTPLKTTPLKTTPLKT